MGRTSDARERLLAAGRDLLGRRPYGSLGVAEICAAAGVPKGSFYYFFPSKQDLALAVIDEHWEWQGDAWRRILDAERPVAERLRQIFMLTADVQRDARNGTGSVTGCMFGNLALEMSSEEAAARDRLQEIFRTQVDMVEAALRDDHSGYSRVDADLHDVATSVVAQLEGLVLFAKLFNDPSQLEQHWNATAALLGLDPISTVE